MNDRTIGRAGFLGILGAGALGLFFARDVDRACSAVSSRTRSPRSCRRGGWRIYTVGARCRTSTRRPTASRSTASSTTPKTFTLADLKAMPRAEQVSDFHCVTGWSVSNVRWAGVRINEVLERGRRRRKRQGAHVRLGRGPVQRLAHARPGAAPRRDARLRDGRQAALARPRRPRPARDAADVRLQERQVGQPHRAAQHAPTSATGSRTGTTRMRGSGGRTALASEPGGKRRLPRFNRTERALHWTHASAFFTLLATG